MQSMAASLKHLIDSPASTDGNPESPSAACCRVVDALAGDCSSSIGERLRIVEAECGFGARCSRGCAGLPPADCGFVGAGRSSLGRVTVPAMAATSGNASCFMEPGCDARDARDARCSQAAGQPASFSPTPRKV